MEIEFFELQIGAQSRYWRSWSGAWSTRALSSTRPSFSPIDGCGWPVVFPMLSEIRIASAQQSPLRSLLKWCFWNRNLHVFWRNLEGRKNTQKLRVKMKKWIDYRFTWKIPAIMISRLSAVLWLESGGARLGEQLSSWAEVGGSLLLGLGKTTSLT